jgi:hypothetical protein
VGENVVRVPKPVNRKPNNEFLVLDYETGNLVPPQEKECGNVDQPVDGESTVGPCAIDSELKIGPVVALVRKHCVQ